MVIGTGTLGGTEMKIIGADDVPANTRRGGDIRTLLSPATVGSTSGFMGVATIEPGEVMGEHYHPYSEEFVYVTRGELTAVVDGETHHVHPGQAFYLGIESTHRLLNQGSETVEMVFHLGPLAPRPELGHVDLEGPDAAGTAAATGPVARP